MMPALDPIAWAFEEHWSGEKASYSNGRVTAFVRDYDGDYAGWDVKIDARVVASGENHDFQSFSTAITCAEIAINASLRDEPHWVCYP